MGTFQGHFLPGCIFLAFGTWWSSQIPRRSIMCSMQGKPFYCTVTYPCPMHGRCVEWPLEAAVKILAAVIGVTAEMLAAANFGQGGGFVFLGDLQHATMYAFFGLSGVVDILRSYGKVPKGVDYLAIILAFVVEALLFSQHNHGGGSLAVTLHSLLTCVVCACAVATLLELNFRCWAQAGLARAFSVLLQGTWFIQIGFILHNPIDGVGKWDHESNDSQLRAAVLFTWHLLGVALLLGAIVALSRFLNRRHCRPTAEDMSYELLSSTDDDSSGEELGQTMMYVDDNVGASQHESDDPYSMINASYANSMNDQSDFSNEPSSSNTGS